MAKKKKSELRVHNILADGREVESLEGFQVRLEQVPGLVAILEKRIREREEEKQRQRDGMLC